MSKRYSYPRQSLLSCVRKVRHKTLEQAQLAKMEMEQKTGEHFNTYYCALCGGFHIGREKGRSYRDASGTRGTSRRDGA